MKSLLCLEATTASLVGLNAVGFGLWGFGLDKHFGPVEKSG
jgi:hypothetical protein